MRVSFRTPLVLLSSLSLLGAAEATAPVEVKIEPGLWQVTTNIKMPLVEETKTKTVWECLTESPFTPERIAANQRGCDIDAVAVSDNEMSWEISCKNQFSSFKGSGSFKSSGSEATGKMKTVMKLGEQSMESHTTWEGMRLGECGMEVPSTPVKKPGQSGAKTPKNPSEKDASGSPAESTTSPGSDKPGAK